MFAYILRRLLLMIPTLFGILLVTFAIVQFAPGGPVEQMLAKLTQGDGGNMDRIAGSSGDIVGQEQSGTGEGAGSFYRGSSNLDPKFIEELNKQFGFDKPAHERFFKMVWDYSRFDFGESFFRNARVIDLILEKLPVSISLGLFTTLIAYLISIPLGVAKAVRDGSSFDVWTSGVVIVSYAIPGFLFAILLIVLFAGGSFWQIFPLQGLWSEKYASMPFWEWITSPSALADYAWHLVLPLTAMCLSSFATLTLLTKNSFIDEVRKQYVMTARMKGLTENRVLYGHVFRNAMLIVIAGFPSAFIGIFLTGALLIETIFSLDGLGLLGYKSIVERDYPIVFGSLFIFSLAGLVGNLISDLTYVWVDPRIDFESREV